MIHTHNIHYDSKSQFEFTIVKSTITYNSEDPLR